MILLILFFEWFYKHPSLRYGGYQLVCLLLFIPFSEYLRKKIIRNLRFKIYFIILLSFVIFFSRNLDRILDEEKKYDFNLLKTTNYRLTENNFRINNQLNNLLFEQDNCLKNTSKCNQGSEIYLTNIAGYKAIIKRNK